ncbi:EEF1A lysine methyltransferase 4 [Selaginella moellendorffii]|uniref:EEF1A lysine methyltransferase 4 n=1 Tax=Selaginella moellendorffii TaxID=88036 RepID=UPI000D1CC123|nr:EEF1A lysine methyltransferase 4 [Selaginella moellendorffii]|eukprot:XP_024529589.1 EEF1A lysine methyltransferase 4 [Selaginella moellendorffii]
MAEDVRSYLEPSYWDERFSRESHYEWFKDYSQFQHLIHAHCSGKNAKILELGCGNSRMSEDMYRDGFTDITATDLSPVAVESKRRRCSDLNYGIKVLVADIMDMPFKDASFDVVIEKGVMDVLFVDSGSPWDPEPQTRARVDATLKEVHRVLGANGVFISIAFGQPHFRRPFFEASDFEWSMEYSTFGDSFHYYFYTLRKGMARKVLPRDSMEFTSIDMVQEQMDDEDYIMRTMMVDDDKTTSS